MKTSIRFYNNIPIRAKWDDETSKWWYSAVDLIYAIVGTENARRYWNVLKSRNIELKEMVKSCKLTSKDGKKYSTDIIDDNGINKLLIIIPKKNNDNVIKWLKGLMNPVDE